MTLDIHSTIKKWLPVLEHEEMPPIADSYRKSVTAQLLENQQIQSINEAGEPANVTGGVDRFDPVLISMVRRAMPNLVAYDICGVQPMTGPTGLIFAMRSRYSSQAGTEALFNEADTSFSGTGTHTNETDVSGAIGGNPTKNWAGAGTSRYGATTMNAGTGRGLATALGEGSITGQMAFSIERISVTAQTRTLSSSYSQELAQDMKAIHGLNAENELANILSTEILAEINREVVRKVNSVAKVGCGGGSTATNGLFDLDTDSNGRWSVEKFKGLLFQIEREANVIAKQTRRGKGNVILCSSDVASALSMAGVLDFTPALNTNLNVDDTGNTFAGTLNGKFRVYIDPYFSSNENNNYVTVGYKGSKAMDAGLFYCPYVPLQMVRAVDPTSFQPKLGFKTRYGIVENPFIADNTGDLQIGKNIYYRIFGVKNLM